MADTVTSILYLSTHAAVYVMHRITKFQHATIIL
jgi:hypothetical protein